MTSDDLLILNERPEIAMGVIKVLSRRLRETSRK